MFVETRVLNQVTRRSVAAPPPATAARLHPASSAIAPLTAAFLVTALAGAAAGAPVLSIAAAVASWLLVVGVIVRASLPMAFLKATGVLLFAYASLGKTAAYFGAPPVFVGEVVLALGVLAVALTPARRLVVDTLIAKLIVLFGVWGALRTLPFLREYGTDALRDAVIWGYAAVGMAFAACARHTGGISPAIRAYGRAIPLFLIVTPCAFLISRAIGEVRVLDLPGMKLVLPLIKAGDVGVHLGGIAVFLLLQLHRGEGGLKLTRFKSVFVFTTWLLFCLAAISLNRGALLAVVAALGIVALLHPRAVGLRVLGAGTLAACAAVLVLLTFDKAASARTDADRAVSVHQLAENIRSVLGRRTSSGNLDGTKDWRLDWWREIVGYTVMGREFYGKGFGINLANDDGFQVAEDESLRSPHSIHMTVLARTGVPGLLLWTALNLSFALAMLAGHLSARRAHQYWWAGTCTWLLAYWAALVVNGSVDVFIEGPMGGFWFWIVIGGGIAVLDQARRERATRQLGYSTSQ